MNFAKALAITGIAVMGGVLGNGFARGDFFKEGSQLIRMPWGIVSLADVYVGFSFISAWVVFREKSLSKAIAWVAAIMTLGNIVSSVYVLLALLGSRGDWQRFWLGNRSA
jgi:hypothetical protein